MCYLLSLSMIAVLTLGPSFSPTPAYAQRDVEEKVRKPKPKPTKPRTGGNANGNAGGNTTANRQPKSQPKPQPDSQPNARPTTPAPAEGDLAIETNPTAVSVIVKAPDGKIVAQEQVENGKFARKLTPGKYNIEVGAEGYAPVKKEVVIKSAEKEMIPILLSPNTGSIILGPLKDGAVILLNGQDPASQNIRVRKLSDHIELRNVKEGTHTVRVERAGYLPLVKSQIEVRGGMSVHLQTDMEEAGADLLVITEPGTSVYLDDEYIGEASREGRLRRTSLSTGSREIKLTKSGYEEFKSSYQFTAGKEMVIEKVLTPKTGPAPAPAPAVVTEDFGGNLSRWATTSSAGWALKEGRLEIANMPTLGYLRNSNFKDFTLTFHLRLVNGAGAAWAVRAANSKDYYLFYLSGSKGLFRKRFITYIVRNNSFNPQVPDREAQVETKLSAGSEYRVVITVTQNRIEHQITPLDSGQEQIIGVFEDQSGLFPTGTVGFRTVGPEIFSVDDLNLKPHAPPNAK